MEQRLRRCESVQTLHFFFLKSSWTVMFVTNSVARPDHMFGMLVLGASACAQGLGPVVVHWISSHNCRTQPRWQQLP